MTDQDKADREYLMSLPAFRRFLSLHAIQSAGIFSATANGSDGRNLYLEGRRSLGLDMLRDVDEAQPLPAPSGIPVITVLQLLREDAQSTPQEKPNGRRSDPYSDIRADSDAS